MIVLLLAMFAVAAVFAALVGVSLLVEDSSAGGRCRVIATTPRCSFDATRTSASASRRAPRALRLASDEASQALAA